MSAYNPLAGFKIKNLISVFSLRDCGNMSLAYGNTKDALENRKKFLSKINIDYQDLICAKQVHGKHIEFVTEKDRSAGSTGYESSLADCDGFITDRLNLPVGILTADCLSVFIYEPRRPAIALLHAGWRSSEANICAQAVKLMREKFGSKAQDMLVGFGPSLRVCCFEVGEDFKTGYPQALTRKNNRLYMDLAQLNSRQLIAAGVLRENIFDPKFCTFCQAGDFFSFRREAHNAGRMISVMALTEK